MIVYGWGYFNRREHSLVRDNCRACGRAGYLRSYTSSKFFTLYFVPVIPLGNEKVVHDCPHCKQSFSMSLRKWRKLRREELPKAVAAYEAAPADPEAARGLVGACIGLQDTATLRQYAPRIRAAFARDAAILGLLAGACSYLCLDKEADTTYLDAVALTPDGPVAQEANAHLELQKLPKPKPPNRLLQSLPVLIVPAILLFIALGYLEKAVTGGIDRAYLVNGLERPYTVVVNGERLTLRPHTIIRTQALGPGRNELAPGDGALGLVEPQTFDVPVGLWDRMFARTLAVVNPDGAAVVAWERTGYAYPKAPDDVHEMRVSTGELVHVFKDIDFEFVAFPEQISLPSKTGVTYRTRVSEIGSLPLAQLVNAIVTHADREMLARYVRARLRGGVGDTDTIHLAARILPHDEFLTLARKEIATIPVQIEWHRAYQTIAEGTPEGKDLVATYRALVEQHPDDSTLLYLLGRVIEDPAESVPVFERAARMATPSAYAANALAYHYALEAEPLTAVAWSDEAIRLDPKNRAFRGMRMTVLYGAGKFQLLEQEIGDPLLLEEQRLAEFRAHVYRLGKLGRSGEVGGEIDRLVRRMRALKEVDDTDEPFVRAFLQSGAALASGDREQFAQSMKRLPGPGYAFQAAVATGDLARAQEVATSGEWSAHDRLLLYVLLSRQGQVDAAASQLAQAVKVLQAGTGDEQRWAAWLQGDEPPSVSTAAHVCPDVDSHATFLTALAVRHPGHAAAYLERAGRIRFGDSYATLALDASAATR